MKTANTVLAKSRFATAADLAALSPVDRERVLAALDDAELEEIEACWPFWARPEQLPPPGDWRVWLYCAGRGAGKTKSGSEWVRAQVKAGCRRIALVAPTAADVRDVMVEGESGILAISPNHERPLYEPSKRRLTWPNGAIATTYSAEEPERLRGPQHEIAYCDEIGAWSYSEDTWSMLMFGMRLGGNPRIVATTTPRPTKLLRDLLNDPTVAVTRGTTYDNRANLPASFLHQIIRKYEGTRLGRQELNAELLEDVPGALWTRAMIEAARPPLGFRLPELTRIVVAIDPAVSSDEGSDETGIIVAGKDASGRGYVLGDLSGQMTPTEWAKAAIAAYHAHKADRIVAERNNGGAMVEATIRMVDPNVPLTTVWASRGKVARAEPVSALYEQGRIKHCAPLSQLEDQLCSLTSDRSMEGLALDRADALAWAMTELLVEPMAGFGIFEYYRQEAAAAKTAATVFEKPKIEYAIGSMEWAAQQAVVAEEQAVVAELSGEPGADVRARIAERIAQLQKAAI